MKKKSQFSFVHFIDPNEVNEEHIGRLIKNLKRQLEKIFELKRSMFGEDVIALSPIGIAKTIMMSLRVKRIMCLKVFI